jgi:ribonuclease E
MVQKTRTQKTETAIESADAAPASVDVVASPQDQSAGESQEQTVAATAEPAGAPASEEPVAKPKGRGRRSRSTREKKVQQPAADGQPEGAEEKPAADDKPAAAPKAPRAPRSPANKPAAGKASEAAKVGKLQMIISYVPGEECRVAVVEDGKLEEFHAERAASMSRVGNIYVGRVTNVEPAIQAAFVDFGVDHHGFLHVSDVHPRYFPGEDDETTESVGKKTPRRDRPPIQRCFRRGDEVLVQVLKEGVGTKGPTLTSYLSVPGRFLVMMPQMDKVGVSRKVEDEEQRREMRAILDQLELPEGFGFILRTAGMERTKQELKRDLAYLMRLWKDMEGRRGTGNKPRLLYSESDLLVRALRDMLAPEIDEVIIDNELALARAARFLKIVAPRSKVRLLQFAGQMPLFHAFGVEQQIATMNAREVPLPGGGRLVIDETEALVAIDVNSGRMRDARDAETNAYRTNCEAVEEICRQLKLRDLGGIVINDLIDMRLASHRKDIEQRFRDRLKRDRARSTILPISNFGILEMTRQRMRGSHETVHFGDCPTCRGRGIVQKPDSVASDSLRNLAALLDHENVARVEMVVSPRVASELLSSRRKTLNKLERTSGKHVDVRVSETIPIDRITFYAYDAAGADIDVESLPKPRAPRDLKVWELPRSADDEAWAADLSDQEVVEEQDLTPAEQAELADLPAHPIEVEDSDEDVASAGEGNGEGGRKRRRRRRRRGGRGGDRPENGEAVPARSEPHKVAAPAEDGQAAAMVEIEAADASGPRAAEAQSSGAVREGDEAGEGGEGGRRRRRRRRRRGGRGGGGQNGAETGGGTETDAAAEAQDDEAAEPVLLPDPDAPRGDSWDLPPGAVPSLSAAPKAIKPAAAERTESPREAAAMAPIPSSDADDETGGPSAPGLAPANGGEAQGEDQDRPQGRSRRRRRGGRGGGQRQGDAGKESPPAAAPAAAIPKPAPLALQKPAREAPRSEKPVPEVRGGGYRKKSAASAPAASPAVGSRPPLPAPASAAPKKPASALPVVGTAPPAAAIPAPGSGQPAKPKRVLYSTRRRLSPAELAKRPKPE